MDTCAEGVARRGVGETTRAEAEAASARIEKACMILLMLDLGRRSAGSSEVKIGEEGEGCAGKKGDGEKVRAHTSNEPDGGERGVAKNARPQFRPPEYHWRGSHFETPGDVDRSHLRCIEDCYKVIRGAPRG